MHWLFKAVLILAALAISASTLNLWFNTFYLGSYFANAGIGLVILGFAMPVVTVILAIYAIKVIIKA